MSLQMDFEFWVDRTLLKMSLAVLISDLIVVISPGEFIILPPTVIRVQCVSDFCGRISATILP